MSAELLAEKVREMIPDYQRMFDERGGVVPVEPLKFHLYHIALYWRRLIGFCKEYPKPEGWIYGDLGACIQVGSIFAHKLISPDSPIYDLWQEYWAQTQALFHERPVTMEAIEAASKVFDDCLKKIGYNPFSS